MSRDLALICLAALVGVCVCVCITVLALNDKVAPELAVPLLTTMGTGIGVAAIGRLSGANGS